MKHSGGLYSYISLLWTFPDMGVGIFASVNGPGYGLLSTFHNALSFSYISDYLLGLEPWLNSTTACTFPKPWQNGTSTASEVKETPSHVDNFTDYEGSYGNHLFADAEVYSNTSSLYLNSNHIHGILHPSTEQDKFQFEITYPWEFSPHDNNTQRPNITFNRDQTTGMVNALTVQLEVGLKYFKGESLFDVSTKSVPRLGKKDELKTVKSARSPVETSLICVWIGVIMSTLV